MQPETGENISDIKLKLQSLQAQLDQAEKSAEVRKLEAAPLQTILRWDAPNRVYVERGRPWYVTISFLFMVAIAFAAITKEPLLILALLALMALVYVSASIKPKLVGHEITNKGIRTNNQLYQWRSIEGFWISRRAGQQILIVDLRGNVNPNRILLLIGSADPVKILEILNKHIPYLTRKEIGEDIVNIFTLGEYEPITKFLPESANQSN